MLNPLLEYFQDTENVTVSDDIYEVEAFKISAKLFNNYGFRFCGLLFLKRCQQDICVQNLWACIRKYQIVGKPCCSSCYGNSSICFAVNNANWYKPGNAGLESIQRVRLMHAGMRMALLNDSRPDKKWNNKLSVRSMREDLQV